MDSERKKRKAVKAHSVTPEQPKLPRPGKPTSEEALIRHNGDLVEELYSSEVWSEIILPLIQESVAGVSGRYTNGRFYRGSLTSSGRPNLSLEKLSGYQLALEDLVNNLHDFIGAKARLAQLKKEEKAEKSAPIYNPYMDEFEDDANGKED